MASVKPPRKQHTTTAPSPTRGPERKPARPTYCFCCWPCTILHEPDLEKGPRYRYLIPYPRLSGAMVITHVKKYSTHPSIENGVSSSTPTYSAREIDALHKALDGIDFKRSERGDARYFLHALAALSPHSHRTSLLAPVRAVKSILVGERHPSSFFATPMPRGREEVREKLASVVHRRMAVLRLEGLGGSVRKLEDWYRDVVEVVGWRDAEEGKLGWLWREDGGVF